MVAAVGNSLRHKGQAYPLGKIRKLTGSARSRMARMQLVQRVCPQSGISRGCLKTSSQTAQTAQSATVGKRSSRGTVLSIRRSRSISTSFMSDETEVPFQNNDKSGSCSSEEGFLTTTVGYSSPWTCDTVLGRIWSGRIVGI